MAKLAYYFNLYIPDWLGWCAVGILAVICCILIYSLVSEIIKNH
jgi:hypothetical protein